MPLVVVKDKVLPVITAVPFTTIEPAVKPLPKPIPPDEEEVTVKPLMAVALCPSVSVMTTLCPPTTAVGVIVSVTVILVLEL